MSAPDHGTTRWTDYLDRCPTCGAAGALVRHWMAGTCHEVHGEPGWAKAKRLARDGAPSKGRKQ